MTWEQPAATGLRLGKELNHVESHSFECGLWLSVLRLLVSMSRSAVKGGFVMRTKKPEDRGRQTAWLSPGGKEPNSVPANSFFFLTPQVKSQRQLGQPKGYSRKCQEIENSDASNTARRGTVSRQIAAGTTLPGTRRRAPLFDEDDERIRGKDNKDAAQLALARIKLSDELAPVSSPVSKEWTVAEVCEIYLSDLTNTASPEWVTLRKSWLNDFCGYCGALAVSEPKKHLRTWLQRHKTWNNNTQRNVIACIKAAFNFCCKFDDLSKNSVASYQKPVGGTGYRVQQFCEIKRKLELPDDRVRYTCRHTFAKRTPSRY